MTAVVLEALAKTFPGAARPALDGVGLALPPASLTTLVGPSGGGKSTLLAIVAGLLAPDRGRVTIGGTDVTRLPPERRGAVMMGQDALLFPHLTVAGNVGFGLRLRGLPRARIAAAVDEALAAVRLPGFGPRRVAGLSGGEAQRVALARALATRPAVLLLDEPFAALDPDLRADMGDLLAALQRRTGTTMLLVTHDRAEAAALGTLMAVVLDGRIAAAGPPEDAFERPPSLAVARFLGAGNLFEGRVRGGRFEAAFGPLRLAAPAAEGPAVAMIRPEAVRLGGGPENRFTAVAVAVAPRGTHAVVTAAIGGATLLLSVEAALARSLALGAPLPLALPPERIHVIPASGSVPVRQTRGG